MEKEVLNKKEKLEIKGDVKDALNKARFRTLSQKEIDNINKSIRANKNLPVIASILIIVTIVVGFTYFYIANNPKTIFINSLDGLFKNVSSSFDNDIIQGQITINENNSKVLINYSADKDHLVASTGDSNLYLNKNNAYILSKDISEHYIILDNSLNYNKEMVSDVFTGFNKAISKALETQKYSSGKATLDHKPVKVISLDLEGNQIKKVIDEIKSNLINDDVFLSAYGNITGKNANDVKNMINAYSVNYDNLHVKIYSEDFNHHFMKLQVLNNENNILTIDKLSDNKYQVEYYNNRVTSVIHKTSSLKTPNVSDSIEYSQLDSSSKAKLNNIIEGNKFLNFVKGS